MGYVAETGTQELIVAAIHRGYLKMVRVTSAGNNILGSERYVHGAIPTDADRLKSEYESGTAGCGNGGYTFVKGNAFADCFSAQATTDYTIRVKGKPTMCLNARSGNLAAGDVIHLFTCSAAANEQFEFRESDSTIRVKAKPTLCLNAHSGYLAQGDVIQLYTCSASANEQFSPRWPQVPQTCPIGYQRKHADIPNGDQFGRGFSNPKATIDLCAADCNQRAACLSFEFSPSEKQCFLNKVKAPVENGQHKDFVFCERV